MSATSQIPTKNANVLDRGPKSEVRDHVLEVCEAREAGAITFGEREVQGVEGRADAERDGEQHVGPDECVRHRRSERERLLGVAARADRRRRKPAPTADRSLLFDFIS